MANRKSKSLSETSTQAAPSRPHIPEPTPTVEDEAFLEQTEQIGAGDVFQKGGPGGIVAPISPVSVIERLTRAGHIDAPFHGVGGRLWIPLRDPNLDEDVRQALKAVGYTVFDGTMKIGKLGRENQTGFITCLPPGKTATLPNLLPDPKVERGKKASRYDDELRRLGHACKGKQRCDERQLRKQFPAFTIWKAIDDSRVSPTKREEFFADPTTRTRMDRFGLIGEIFGVAEATAYDDFKAFNKAVRRQRSS